MFLVDTNVISELAPPQTGRNAYVVAWLEAMSPQLFLSVITIAEVTAGIAKSRREGATQKAELRQVWLDRMQIMFGSRILPFDRKAAVIAGELLDRSRAHQPGFPDIAIAAIATVHGLTVATRNTRHFGPLGVPLINPFDTQLPHSDE